MHNVDMTRQIQFMFFFLYLFLLLLINNYRISKAQYLSII
jgi:hypothetical protein